MTDKILYGICIIMSRIFGLIAAVALVAIVFGLLVARHTDGLDVMEQVRALGLVFMASFIAGISFDIVGMGKKYG